MLDLALAIESREVRREIILCLVRLRLTEDNVEEVRRIIASEASPSIRAGVLCELARFERSQRKSAELSETLREITLLLDGLASPIERIRVLSARLETASLLGRMREAEADAQRAEREFDGVEGAYPWCLRIDTLESMPRRDWRSSEWTDCLKLSLPGKARR